MAKAPDHPYPQDYPQQERHLDPAPARPYDSNDPRNRPAMGDAKADGVRFFMKDGQLIMARPNKPDVVAAKKDTDENKAAYQFWLDSDERKVQEAKAAADKARDEREAKQLRDGGEGDRKK